MGESLCTLLPGRPPLSPYWHVDRTFFPKLTGNIRKTYTAEFVEMGDIGFDSSQCCYRSHFIPLESVTVHPVPDVICRLIASAHKFL